VYTSLTPNGNYLSAMARTALSEQRRENLRLLKGSQTISELAGTLALSANMVSQLLNASEQGKTMGEKLARKIEDALGLPRYWLDQPHEEGTNTPVHRTVSPVSGAGLPERTLCLTGLNDMQIALLVTAEALCRTGKISDKEAIGLLASWQSKLD
jgi:hypothetical protein